MKPTLATAIEAHYERVKRAHIMRYSGFGNYFTLNESGDLPHTKNTSTGHQLFSRKHLEQSKTDDAKATMMLRN